MTADPAPPADAEPDAFRRAILEAARGQVRRHGEAKTNVVDIARALGTSHTTLYRHFRSKAEIFEAVVRETMAEEQALARAIAAGPGTAAERLEALVLALHARKRERFGGDPEIFALYRRVMQDSPGLVGAYAAAMTAIVAGLLEEGVARGEFRLDDVAAAAGVVRDAVTAFVHPVLVAAAVAAGGPGPEEARRVVRILCAGFRAGPPLN